MLPSSRKREAERRQALGCSGTRRRANDVRPQALARRFASSDVGRSPLGAPPRDLWHPGPRGMKQEGFTVCELLASAHSGGGRVSGASRVLLARQRRGTPHPALLMRCLAKSTLGGRNGADYIPIRILVIRFLLFIPAMLRSCTCAVHSTTRFQLRGLHLAEPQEICRCVLQQWRQARSAAISVRT